MPLLVIAVLGVDGHNSARRITFGTVNDNHACSSTYPAALYSSKVAAPTTFAITHFLVNDNCLITVRVDIRFGEGPGESSVVYYPIVATRPNMALLCTRQCLISKSSPTWKTTLHRKQLESYTSLIPCIMELATTKQCLPDKDSTAVDRDDDRRSAVSKLGMESSLKTWMNVTAATNENPSQGLGLITPNELKLDKGERKANEEGPGRVWNAIS
ncbi:DNA replication checkpoint protein tel2 [Fusarium oxysporum f. sp. albedinis]|nr:DNA replication checkpoint protein tel2 [Fusarium oxysporum f. sp. albedinis]